MIFIIKKKGDAMMKYIWINPVVEKMYGDALKHIFKNKDINILSCSGQIEKVKDKFKREINNSNKTILDTRCPLALDCAKQVIPKNKYKIPLIEPIVIHTARYLYDTYIKGKSNEIIITTPCKPLKDMGNKLFKDNYGITFFTWLEVCKLFNIPSVKKCDVSPVPLGFFRDISKNVLEKSGQDNFRKDFIDKKYDVVEMLYCLGGCNNGDGV